MKKMISFGVVTIMTCMIVNISIAQENGNYYRQCRKWEAYFNANPNLKNEEDGDYKQFANKVSGERIEFHRDHFDWYR